MLDSTYHFIFDATDSGSGIWKYDLYGKRAESSEWELLFRDIKDSEFTQVIPEGASYNYCVVATDMAGNRELKELHAEGLELLTGDADGNGMVDVADVMVITNHFLGNNVDINLPNADVNSDNAIDSQDCMGVNAIYLNASDKARIKNLPTRYKPTQK